MTLTEFLLARIAEVEYDARWGALCDTDYGPRVLARCAADRRIVGVIRERYPHYDALRADDGARGEDRMHGIVCRMLALPYADHPDYRQEWKP